VHGAKLKESLRNNINDNNNVSCSASDKNIDVNFKEVRLEGSDTSIERTERNGVKDGGEMGRKLLKAQREDTENYCTAFSNSQCHVNRHGVGIGERLYLSLLSFQTHAFRRTLKDMKFSRYN
jgi:hypothetical protein